MLGSAGLAVPLVTAGTYMAHYGMTRAAVPAHISPHLLSWDCAAVMSNALMLNLPTHASHHKFPGRSFQVASDLDADHVPTMPLPYSVLAILAFVPPLFFRVMDPALDAITAEFNALAPLKGRRRESQCRMKFAHYGVFPNNPRASSMAAVGMSAVGEKEK